MWSWDPDASGRLLTTFGVLEMAARNRIGSAGSIRASLGMAFRRLVLFCLGGSDATKHASLRSIEIHLEPNRSGGWAFEIMSGTKWWVELVFDQKALRKRGL